MDNYDYLIGNRYLDFNKRIWFKVDNVYYNNSNSIWILKVTSETGEKKKYSAKEVVNKENFLLISSS